MMFLNTLLAQGLEGFGKLGLKDINPSEAPGIFEELVSKVVGFLTIAAILWFTLQIIFAAFGFLTAGGDPKAVEGARKKIMNAIVGLLIVFSALVILSVIGTLVGIDILNIQDLLIEIGQ